MKKEIMEYVSDGKIYPQFFFKSKKNKQKDKCKITEDEVRVFKCPMDILSDIINRKVIDTRVEKQYQVARYKYLDYFMEPISDAEKSGHQFKKVKEVVEAYDRTVKDLNKSDENYEWQIDNAFSECMTKIKKWKLKQGTMRALIVYALSSGCKYPIRMMTRHEDVEVDEAFIKMRVKNAWEYRKKAVDTSSCRVIFGEADFLPGIIVEGNSLQIDWESVVAKYQVSYIMGNPPFVGYSLQSKEQKNDILSVYVDEKGKPYKTAGKIDYVAGWYFKAAQFMQGTTIRTAFVSTNSITQGEQVAGVWKPLYDRFGIHIDFAHRTFIWDSEASMKAHVHCVIVGFSIAPNSAKRRIYVDKMFKEAENINAYLVEAPDIFIESRTKPICDCRKMTSGNRPADGGHLIIEDSEYQDFIKEEPKAIPYIKRLSGATEFINNKKRWCLWLVGVSPVELRKMPKVLERIEACKKDRLEGAEDRRKLAETPALFRETKNPDTAIVVPRHSSENRRYIPFGFIGKDMILTDAAMCIPDGDVYEFGILESNIHMAWMRTVCGRIKSDYRYSKDIVYNNFPWPEPTAQQRQKIEQTAQSILDARALYPDSSLADLYDELTMPPELRKAHHQNDMAVMQAYGFKKDSEAYKSEAACVAELMKRYQKLCKIEREK